MSSFGDCHWTKVSKLNPKNELRPRVANRHSYPACADEHPRGALAQASYAKPFDTVKQVHLCMFSGVLPPGKSQIRVEYHAKNRRETAIKRRRTPPRTAGKNLRARRVSWLRTRLERPKTVREARDD